MLQRQLPHPPPDDGGMGGLVRDPFRLYVDHLLSHDRKLH